MAKVILFQYDTKIKQPFVCEASKLLGKLQLLTCPRQPLVFINSKFRIKKTASFLKRFYAIIVGIWLVEHQPVVLNICLLLKDV